jgi:hypothetical protein
VGPAVGARRVFETPLRDHGTLWFDGLKPTVEDNKEQIKVDRTPRQLISSRDYRSIHSSEVVMDLRQ